MAKDSFITAIPIIPAHHTNKSIISTTISSTPTAAISSTTRSFNIFQLNSRYLSTGIAATASNVTENGETKENEQCGHVFTTYIVPSIMHLASYILGFIFFRINENETLYAYVFLNLL